MQFFSTRFAAAAALLSCAALPACATAQQTPPSIAQEAPTYADLADLADAASLVLVAQPRKVVRVENARAPGLAPGHGRFYVRARTSALLFGPGGIGESLTYLVDLPLDSRGRGPSIKKRDVILFARTVAGRPGEIQLVAPSAQLLRSPETESRLRAILVDLAAPGAPGKVTGVREMIHVPGTLAGEGETQIFLATSDGSAASIAVKHFGSGRTEWGASFSELVADTANPPSRESLEWYRLACFLPNTVAAAANLSPTASGRAQAMSDYRMVLGELGTCPRTRR
ncbi:MAG: hypothetical protein R3D89_08370 [Sphingomonadaceae bacterium]